MVEGEKKDLRIRIIILTFVFGKQNRNMENQHKPTTDLDLSPGETIKRKLKKCGLKQNFLAKELGINTTALSEMMNDHRKFPSEILEKIEQKLSKYV